MYGYIDDNAKEFSSNTYGIFGLNTGTITEISFIGKADSEDKYDNTFILDINIEENSYKTFISEPTRVFSGGEEIFESDENYQELFERATKEKLAVITHIVKSTGINDEEIKKLFKTPAKSFAEWCTRMVSIVPKKLDKIDIFLEYQYYIKEGNTMTFLQIPKNLKGGKFITKHIVPVGNWKAVNTWEENGVIKDGLAYIDQADNLHLFKRNKNYMNSNKAKQQKINDEEDKIEETTSSSNTW